MLSLMDEGRKRVLLIAASPRGTEVGAVREWSTGSCHGERHCRFHTVGGTDNGGD